MGREQNAIARGAACDDNFPINDVAALLKCY
jgi:hypothetical protein